MRVPQHYSDAAINKRAGSVPRIFIHAAWAVGLMFLASCNPARPGPATTTTTAGGTTTTAGATTTTTAGATTTTTAGATTTTTTTTTTTAAGVDYATQVHPIWDSENCTQCHDASHALNLVGSPTETCSAIAARDASNADLIIVGGAADNSQIITKPMGVSHAGGAIPCFGNGAACFDTVLQWLTAGANGPGGGTCGS